MLTFNLEGFKRNKFYLSSLLEKYNPILVFVQEHWLPHFDATNKFKTNFSTHNFLTTSEDMFTPAEDLLLQPGPVWHGTALGWSMSIDKCVTRLPVVSDRFCGIQIKNAEADILAYSAYMPTAGKDSEFLEVLSSLSEDIKHYKNKDTTLVIGCDSNQSIKSTNRRSSAMNSFVSNFALKTILLGDVPTFHHNNLSSETQIDHIYYFIPANSKVKVELAEQLCLKENPANLSAHDVIVGNITIPVNISSKSHEDFSPSYSEFLVKKPKWSESGLAGYQVQTSQIIQEMFDRFDMVEHIPLLSEMCSKMLVLSAEQNFETSNPKKGHKKKINRPFFSKEHRIAYNEHSSICKEWRLAGRPQEKSHPARAAKLASQRRLQNISRESESSLAIKHHNELMDTYYSNLSQVCAKLKKIRGDKCKSMDIPLIETICGTYEGVNVLEGFRSNTEKLCNEKPIESSGTNPFFQMCLEDNYIILDIISNDNANIPQNAIIRHKGYFVQKIKIEQSL